MIGPVQAELFVRSSPQHTDFFTRLCDALVRVCPGSRPVTAGGCTRVAIDLWPTAHRFRRGYQMRLQISTGAHPRYARNTGSGEPLASATRLMVAEQLIYHDPGHPSGIILSKFQ